MQCYRCIHLLCCYLHRCRHRCFSSHFFRSLRLIFSFCRFLILIRCYSISLIFVLIYRCLDFRLDFCLRHTAVFCESCSRYCCHREHDCSAENHRKHAFQPVTHFLLLPGYDLYIQYSDYTINSFENQHTPLFCFNVSSLLLSRSFSLSLSSLHLYTNINMACPPIIRYNIGIRH